MNDPFNVRMVITKYPKYNIGALKSGLMVLAPEFQKRRPPKDLSNTFIKILFVALENEKLS